MFTIEVEITRRNNSFDEYAVRWNDAQQKAQEYGIGQYRHIPRRKIASNAAKCGIVRKLKDTYKKKKEKKMRGTNMEIGSGELDFTI